MTDTVLGGGKPLTDLLIALLERVAAELPGCLGATVSVRHGDEQLRVLAAGGVGEQLVPAQLRHGGPVPEALATGRPVTTDAVYADDRWPGLTPELGAGHVRGAVAVPGYWDETGAFVLSAALDRPAGPDAVPVLRRYVRLTEMALVVGDSADVAQMLGLLASRASIEQAKGAIMAVRRCSADEAWETLRRASQEFNVKVRELAVALVEQLGRESARQPEGTPEIHPAEAARKAAEQLWAAFAG